MSAPQSIEREKTAESVTPQLSFGSSSWIEQRLYLNNGLVLVVLRTGIVGCSRMLDSPN